VLSCTGLREKGVERVITSADGFLAWHLAIRLNAMLQTEQFPACVSNLDAALADVDANALTHGSRLAQGLPHHAAIVEQLLPKPFETQFAIFSHA
jgi:hypothetical protein